MRAAEDDDDAELGALIRREAVRHAPPAGLADRIRGDLQQAELQRSPRPSLQPAPRAPIAEAQPRSVRWRWLQGLGLFGAGAATAWALVFALLIAPGQLQQPGEALADSLADAHVRSLMASHLADVPSTDQHTVKPWFAGRLDFSPPVVDLAADGMPLTGGRLDYLDGRAVAALVYRAGPHVINLFVWPQADAPNAPPKLLERRGFNLVHWSGDGMQAWAVSDLNATELQSFAALARTRIAASQAPSPAPAR
jgi:anti-sigma factor RsiW